MFSPAMANAALGPMTTLGVGGPARWLSDVRSTTELAAVLAQARRDGLPTMILGDGSNVLISDAGFDGWVIRIASNQIVFVPDGPALHVWADAGVNWDRLVDEAVARHAAGIECLSGIPGRVGAAPMQNIGAYGQEVAETVVAVEAMERDTGRRVTFTRNECGFGYRTSRFKRERDNWVITRVQMTLAVGGPPALRYAELARRAKDDGRPATLTGVKSLVRTIRAEKSMLRVSGDVNFHSAGSFFTNPIVSDAMVARVVDIARARTDATVPAYPAGEPGSKKLSAAWLIEQSGFPKGWGEGRAGLSTRHTLALVNRGGATAAELLQAAITVRDGVRQVFGVSLTPEPVLVGLSWPS